VTSQNRVARAAKYIDNLFHALTNKAYNTGKRERKNTIKRTISTQAPFETIGNRIKRDFLKHNI